MDKTIFWKTHRGNFVSQKHKNNGQNAYFKNTSLSDEDVIRKFIESGSVVNYANSVDDAYAVLTTYNESSYMLSDEFNIYKIKEVVPIEPQYEIVKVNE